MPYHMSSPSSLADAELAIEDTGVESMTIDITPQIDAYFESMPGRARFAEEIRWRESV